MIYGLELTHLHIALGNPNHFDSCFTGLKTGLPVSIVIAATNAVLFLEGFETDKART